MYFPVSGVETSVVVPPLVAFCVSFFASMGGISGAFLLLPFQMSVLGYTHPSVSATNQFYNIVATPGGVYRYIREQRMVWPVALTIAAGTLPGVFAGSLVRVLWLPDPRLFKLFAGFVLLYLGAKLLLDIRKKYKKETTSSGSPAHVGEKIAHQPVVVQEFSLRRVAYSFHGALHQCSTKGLFLLSLVVGIIGGTYGIGGGAIIAPFLVSWFRLPVHTISGATLFATFLTSLAGVIFYAAIAPFFPEYSLTPDWSLGLLFGLGGLAGMYFGARFQKYMPAKAISWMLAVVIIGTAISYFVGFFFS